MSIEAMKRTVKPKYRAPVCQECGGTGKVAGSQAWFDCPECTPEPPNQSERIAELEADREKWQTYSQELASRCTVLEFTASLYEELRRVIGGKTHEDAIDSVKSQSKRIAELENDNATLRGGA